MSILHRQGLVTARRLLFLAAALHAAAAHRTRDDGERQDRPIEMPEARRICASLCIAGLGGRPCGEACSSIEPVHFLAQSQADAPSSASLPLPSPSKRAVARRDACPLLCQYQLGEPLCRCPDFPVDIDSYKVDFARICAYYCIVHAYNVYGCRPCASYQRPPYVTMEAMSRRVRPTDMEIDWEQWCREKCAIGDGGVACNCDILPLPMMLLPHIANLTTTASTQNQTKHTLNQIKITLNYQNYEGNINRRMSVE